jgi:hypothetical protein
VRFERKKIDGCRGDAFGEYVFLDLEGIDVKERVCAKLCTQLRLGNSTFYILRPGIENLVEYRLLHIFGKADVQICCSMLSMLLCSSSHDASESKRRRSSLPQICTQAGMH